MAEKRARMAVDLSAYPDLVVIVLGMKVNALTGLKTLLGLGPQIDKAVGGNPDGLLLHESLIYSLLPTHLVMRQYWRDFDALERFSRSEPHRQWWQKFVRDSGGTGFWHEAYFMRGGMEGIYHDIDRPVGMMNFADLIPARGPMFSARKRMRMAGEETSPAPVREEDLRV
jgi:hypothetical protein